MAVVAAAFPGRARLVRPREPAAALRDALAALPAAHQGSRGKGDGPHLVGFQRLRDLGRRPIVRFVAHALHRVRDHPVHGGLAACLEIPLQDFVDFPRVRGARGEKEEGETGFHRLVPGPR
jgi:hypothetical protein